MSSFPDRLKELRKAKSVTQKAMAEFLGILEQSYQMYEYGKREPNHETTIKLADYFGVSLDYITGRTNYSVDTDGRVTVKTPQDIFNLDADVVKQKSGQE